MARADTDAPALAPPTQRSAVLAVAAGALAVSTSAIFIDLSHTSSVTSSVYRCFLAAPLVAVVAHWEPAGSSRSQRWLVALCGALFAADMIWWAQAIAEVGAGLSTVLVNAQVVILPLLARFFDGERLRASYWLALPPLVAGIVLAGGVLEQGGSGGHAVAGTVHALLAALCYAGFLYLLRRQGGVSPARGYRDTLVWAGAVSLVVGLVGGGLDLAPGWGSGGWLLLVAAVGQAPGWLLVAIGSPRLSAALSACLLLLTPLGALALGVLALGQVPSGLQVLGCGLVLAAVVVFAVWGDRDRG